MPTTSFPRHISDRYEIHEWRHATAILERDFPNEYNDVCSVLTRFQLLKSYIDSGGGRKSKVSGWIDSEFYKLGWLEKKFDTKISVDDLDLESPTHSVDCFKNNIALEIEWKNKGPFWSTI
ncbi:MAG TPA: BglII/BstYI family type II restriction endonuclease [Pyrinomonadaceae bacterium]|nr:BglII/BstYI family type II restriction endonuclease [Pyrinomonadaceae bacterium]